ncbi:MAG: hypothetical protein HOV87_35610 [Catenulispora sp.]|nr:hypothetical protein [Catenulispora sp.]
MPMPCPPGDDDHHHWTGTPAAGQADHLAGQADHLAGLPILGTGLGGLL